MGKEILEIIRNVRGLVVGMLVSFSFIILISSTLWAFLFPLQNRRYFSSFLYYFWRTTTFGVATLLIFLLLILTVSLIF